MSAGHGRDQPSRLPLPSRNTSLSQGDIPPRTSSLRKQASRAPVFQTGGSSSRTPLRTVPQNAPHAPHHHRSLSLHFVPRLRQIHLLNLESVEYRYKALLALPETSMIKYCSKSSHQLRLKYGNEFWHSSALVRTWIQRP